MNPFIIGLILVNLVLAGYLVYVWQKVKTLSKEVRNPKIKRPRRKKVFLTKEQALAIKEKLDEGVSVKALAKEIGCGPTLIWRIKNDRWTARKRK